MSILKCLNIEVAIRQYWTEGSQALDNMTNLDVLTSRVCIDLGNIEILEQLVRFKYSRFERLPMQSGSFPRLWKSERSRCVKS